MFERAFARLGPRYIAAMMIATRVVGSIGGFLVIYYVNLTTAMSSDLRYQFDVVAGAVVSGVVVWTVLLALLETRTLRAVLAELHRGESIPPERAQRAGAQAVLFAALHHQHEMILVPLSTALPLCAYMRFAAGASWTVVVQITIAAFLGISTVLLTTFFASERWMVPVIRFLLDRGIPIEFDRLPPGRIRVRMTVTFGLTIAVTALMIGGLARQRAIDIIEHPELQREAVGNLQEHTVFISAAAVAVGLMLSRFLANSIASRVNALVQAMKRVGGGSLSERVHPTGTDEIDSLARQFNAMVEQLDRSDYTIRELNTGLEHKVKLRTRQLSKSKKTLQRSLKKLQEYDQLKTDFFSNISHELRTPLTMILSPVDRIIETHGSNLPAKVGELLNVVRVNGNRLLDLINHLLEFSKLEAGRTKLSPTAFNANALSRDLAAAAQPLAEQRGIQLRLKLDSAVPLIAADAEKMETVIRNLLSNALKFTPAGGIVEIETKLEPDRVLVAVTDTGIGIAKSDYDRVFERFVQLDSSSSRKYAGTGLGLALVKEFIELHGGEIHVESEIGLGTRFWFTLPLASPTPAALEGAKRHEKPTRTQHFAELVNVGTGSSGEIPVYQIPEDAPHVLVADDTPEMRGLIVEILADHYHVESVADGAEGLAAVHRRHPDLIISDVMMPNVDGYEFCRKIKENQATRHIPFVMLTAKADMSMKIEGLNRGADDYLVKPFSPEELRARVRSLLRLRQLHAELEKRNAQLETTLTDLRNTQTQLVQSEKMSSLGQLVAGLAHEINNSINAVYNGIQPLHQKARKLEAAVIAALEKPAEEERRQVRGEIETAFKKISTLADVIEHGAARTADIVRDLKTFSHPGSEDFDQFDLNASLDICLNLLENQMRHRVTVRRDYGEIGTVRGPSGQLNQVFMNVLSNAQQAIKDRGEITVRTRKEGDRVTIAVCDTGCGIPAENLPRIFDPFFTTKAPGVGTGLGLSISYGIVTKLGGNIEVRSEVGVGTEFVITLPCDAGAGVVAKSVGGERGQVFATAAARETT